MHACGKRYLSYEADLPAAPGRAHRVAPGACGIWVSYAVQGNPFVCNTRKSASHISFAWCAHVLLQVCSRCSNARLLARHARRRPGHSYPVCRSVLAICRVVFTCPAEYRSRIWTKALFCYMKFMPATSGDADTCTPSKGVST